MTGSLGIGRGLAAVVVVLKALQSPRVLQTQLLPRLRTRTAARQWAWLEGGRSAGSQQLRTVHHPQQQQMLMGT